MIWVTAGNLYVFSTSVICAFYLKYFTTGMGVDSSCKAQAMRLSSPHGVPQGLILGPLLFTLYINEPPQLLHNFKSNLYADDTAVTVTGCSNDEIAARLREVLELVSQWFSFNKLSLNYKKTRFMIFGTQLMDSPLKSTMLRVIR